MDKKRWALSVTLYVLPEIRMSPGVRRLTPSFRLLFSAEVNRVSPLLRLLLSAELERVSPSLRLLLLFRRSVGGAGESLSLPLQAPLDVPGGSELKSSRKWGSCSNLTRVRSISWMVSELKFQFRSGKWWSVLFLCLKACIMSLFYDTINFVIYKFDKLMSHYEN